MLRIQVAALLLIQVISLFPDAARFFGSHADFPHSVHGSLSPCIDCLLESMSRLGLSEGQALNSILILYQLALVGLLLGYHTKLSALAACFLHFFLFPPHHAASYGFDQFASFALFVFLWMPVGEAFSISSRGRRWPAASSMNAAISILTLRIALSLVYASAGLEKARGGAWQAGTAVWDVLMQPQFAALDMAVLADWPRAVQVLSWTGMGIELLYPLFAFSPNRVRYLGLAAVTALHLGIAIGMGLWLFSMIMISLSWAALLPGYSRHVADGRSKWLFS